MSRKSAVRNLTFSQVGELEYPRIAPLGCVTHHAFSTDIPSDAVGTIITHNEIVPNIGDLLNVTSTMKAAFDTGARSVLVTFSAFGSHFSHQYHMSKINLIRLINNHSVAFQSARALLRHLESSDFELGAALDDLKGTAFRAPIKGLVVTKFPLWELACLLDESWLQEDVLNGLLELTYFRHYAQSTVCTVVHPGIKPSVPLILPSSFLSDARRIYSAIPRRLSKEMLDIRHRIKTTSVDLVAITSISGDHFVGYIYRPGSCIVEHGDSLGGSPASDVLAILQWVFADISAFPITQIISANVAQQGGRNGGDGSCGITVLNFVERSINPNVIPWTGRMSSVFRNCALQDLVLYNFIAGNFGHGSGLGHLSEACPIFPMLDTCAEGSVESRACGYNDFNMHRPSVSHPIFDFIKSNNTALQRLIRPPTAPVPKVSFLSSTLISQPIDLSTVGSQSALLPACDIVKKGTPPSDSFVATKIEDDDDEIRFSPMRPGHKRKSENLSVDSILEMKSHPFSNIHEVIDLVSPSPPSLSPSHDVKPLPLPSTPPRVQSVNIKPEPTVIDLSACTPDAKPSRIAPPSKVDIDLSSLSSPDIKPPFFLHKNEPAASRSIDVAPGVVHVGAIFHSWEDAQAAIYAREERLGYHWRIAQSKLDGAGKRKKVTFRCNRYQYPEPTHSNNIDPSDYRKGKSIRTGCGAHVNVNRIYNTPNLWHITLTDWTHNHAPAIPKGAPVRRLPTDVEEHTIFQLATDSSQTFSRGQIASILKANISNPSAPVLEPRQIGNIMNRARKQAREEVADLGGDIPAIIASLEQKNLESHGWRFHLKLDEDSVVSGLWWQSPLQAELGQRYGDILINDNTYNRNRSGYPLNIGIVIDGHGSSRNIWYSFHAAEDVAHHNWVFECHLNSAGSPPTALMSDRHKSIIASAIQIFPMTDHLFCIHHLDGNVETRLRRTIGAEWADFSTCFWSAYRAVSPEEFDRLWAILVTKFPAAERYLNDELYSCRTQWAWAFTSFQFTCGVRTNGRVECENRVNKTIGGPKKSLKQLFDGLNERTDGQSVQDMIRVRDSSRRQHAGPIETIFPGPLALLRQHAGPFALQTTFTQMELSMYYQTEVLSRPNGIQDWNEYAVRVDTETGYSWTDGEERNMINQFDNDTPYIATKWLLRLIKGRGLTVEHLLRVTHKGNGSVHMVALLPGHNYVCDCCMGMNLGIPCRHYFQVLSVVKNLRFNLSVVRPRWLQNQDLDLSTIPLVVPHENQATHTNISAAIPSKAIGSIGVGTSANPLEVSHNPPTTARLNLTQTVPSRTVYHESQAALRPLLAGIQTLEQLDDLLEGLDGLRSTQREMARRDEIHDPPVLNPKGRPRTQRLTGPLEGRARGGGAGIQLQRSSAGKKCGICRQAGHNRSNCPLVAH